MKCEEVRDELVAYSRGELEDARHTEIEEHLVRCEGCARELEGVRHVMALTRTADDESTRVLAYSIIRDAIVRGASDIHLESEKDAGRVRYRIDGVLQTQEPLAKEMYEPVVARLKVMAELNLSNGRQPMDGRIAIRHDGKPYDLRVSVFPFHNGENVVMRILDQSSVLIGLGKLGFSSETQKRLEALIGAPQGLLIVTGPTGSGKSTTLYSALNQLNRPEIKIMTIEDPVEYLLAGVNQASVDRKSELTFSSAIRSFLRQDPDVVMIGEMRDLESAELAVETSLTGHLVLTTLHTRDSTEGITRLIDIGIEPFIVSSTLLGILAQRLARRICEACREEYSPSDAALEALGFSETGRPERFFRGRGCDECRQTGYRGRMALTELLVMNEDLGRLVSERASESALRSRARELGALSTFREDARRKIAGGTTTAEEAERVLDGIGSG